MENDKIRLINQLIPTYSKEELQEYLSIQFDYIASKEHSDTIDVLTFYNFLNFPLPISQKLFMSFSSLSSRLSKEPFIFGLTHLYLGTREERINMLILLFDYTQDGTIYYEDIQLLIIHFHCFSSNIPLDHILDFFKEKFDSNHQYSFTTKQMKKFLKHNSDLYFYFFLNFFLRKPFDELSISFYSRYIKKIGKSPSHSKTDNSFLFDKSDTVKYIPSDFLFNYFKQSLLMTERTMSYDDGDLSVLNDFEKDICNVKGKGLPMSIEMVPFFSALPKEDCSNKKHNHHIKIPMNTTFISLMPMSTKNSVGCFKMNSAKEAMSQMIYESILASLYDQTTKTIIKVILYFIGEDMYLFNVNGNNEECELYSFISLKHLFIETDKGFQRNKCNNDKEVDTINKIIKNDESNEKLSVFLISQISSQTNRYQFILPNNEELNKFLSIIHKATNYDKVTDYYQEIKPISKGSFGTVYQIKDKESQKIFAGKVLIKPNGKDRKTLYAYKLEEYIFGLFVNISHAGIAKCYEIYEDDKALYIIQEYYPEGNLNDYFKKKNNYLDSKTIDIFLQQMISSLQFLHKFGIVHRDLKTENILLSKKQTKIIDFGLSIILGAHETSKEQCGTLKYLAPELIEGNDYDHMVDIWCLGIIGYYLYYGKFPYENNNKHHERKILTKGDFFSNILQNDFRFPLRKNENSQDDLIPSFLQKCLEKNKLKRFSINSEYNDYNELIE